MNVLAFTNLMTGFSLLLCNGEYIWLPSADNFLLFLAMILIDWLALIITINLCLIE
jgi:hypothetical protein